MDTDERSAIAQKESGSYLLEMGYHRPAGLLWSCSGYQVDDHVDLRPSTFPGEHLNGRIGVGQRRGLGCDHDNNVVRDLREEQDDFADAGASVTQEKFIAGAELVQQTFEVIPSGRRERGCVPDSRASRQNIKPIDWWCLSYTRDFPDTNRHAHQRIL